MPLEVLTDKSGLLEISRKVERGERLTADDGMALYKTPNVAALSQLADFANQRLNGLRVDIGLPPPAQAAVARIDGVRSIADLFAPLGSDDGARARRTLATLVDLGILFLRRGGPNKPAVN